MLAAQVSCLIFSDCILLRIYWNAVQYTPMKRVYCLTSLPNVVYLAFAFCSSESRMLIALVLVFPLFVWKNANLSIPIYKKEFYKLFQKKYSKDINKSEKLTMLIFYWLLTFNEWCNGKQRKQIFFVFASFWNRIFYMFCFVFGEYFIDRINARHWCRPYCIAIRSSVPNFVSVHETGNSINIWVRLIIKFVIELFNQIITQFLVCSCTMKSNPFWNYYFNSWYHVAYGRIIFLHN